MLSRVAESLYWMSRYIERAENTARLLDVNLQILIDFTGFMEEDESGFWEAVVSSTGEEERFREGYDEVTGGTVTEFLTFDRGNPGSIFSSVCAARENARMIRDQISFEMWECINELYHFVRDGSTDEILRSDVSEFFEQVKAFSHRFQGLTGSTYMQGDGFKFMEIGKHIERADQTSRMIDIKYFMVLPKGADVGGTIDVAGWMAVLRSCSALDAFHSRFLDEIYAWNVGEFLLLARRFPRSVVFSVRQVDENLRALTGTPQGLFTNEPEKLAGRLHGELTYSTISEIFDNGLHEFIDLIQQRLIALHTAVANEFFEIPFVDIEAEIQHQRSWSSGS